jgi:hypothetical protein
MISRRLSGGILRHLLATLHLLVDPMALTIGCSPRCCVNYLRPPLQARDFCQRHRPPKAPRPRALRFGETMRARRATRIHRYCITWRKSPCHVGGRDSPHFRLVSSPRGCSSIASRASFPPTWIDYVAEGPSRWMRRPCPLGRGRAESCSSPRRQERPSCSSYDT